MVVLRYNRLEQHSAASMKVVEITLNDDEINLSKYYNTFSVSDDVRHHPHTMAAFIGSGPFAETSALYRLRF
jgi:hypothetical protein